MYKNLATETFLRAKLTAKLPEACRERFNGRMKSGPLQAVVFVCVCCIIPLATAMQLQSIWSFKFAPKWCRPFPSP